MNSKFVVAAIAASVTILLAAAPEASADTARTARTYKVAFKQVATSCEGTGIQLSRSTLQVSPVGNKSALTVTVPSIPLMKGKAGKKGKFSARAKRGKTAIAGLDGKFSIVGTVSAGKTIEFIFIAEFYKGKTPLCTTSWKGKSAAAK